MLYFTSKLKVKTELIFSVYLLRICCVDDCIIVLNIRDITSTILKSIILVLLMRGIYDVQYLIASCGMIYTEVHNHLNHKWMLNHPQFGPHDHDTGSRWFQGNLDQFSSS
jgi:hypothetical protein